MYRSKLFKIFILFFLVSLQIAQAQMNLKGTKQIMFSVFTNNAQLVFSNYIKDGFAMRYFMAGNYTQNRSFSNFGTEQTLGTKTENFDYQLNLSLGMGFQKSIIKFEDKVDIYAGLDAVLGNRLDKSYSETIVIDSLLADRSFVFNSQNGDFKKRTAITPLSINIGAIPFIGFKYFFHPRLALGAECRMNFFNVFVTPLSKETNEERRRGILTTRESGSNSIRTGITFALNATANITVTILLNKKVEVKKNEIEK